MVNEEFERDNISLEHLSLCERREPLLSESILRVGRRACTLRCRAAIASPAAVYKLRLSQNTCGNSRHMFGVSSAAGGYEESEGGIRMPCAACACPKRRDLDRVFSAPSAVWPSSAQVACKRTPDTLF